MLQRQTLFDILEDLENLQKYLSATNVQNISIYARKGCAKLKIKDSYWGSPY